MSKEYRREDFDFMASRRRNAFISIAQALGRKHFITKLMGSLAWGRHEFEQGPNGNLRSAIREMSALDGIFHVLNIWARDHDLEAQQRMLEIYPRTWEICPRRNPQEDAID